MCSVEGCTRPVTSRGWCATHYKRWQRSGTTDPPARGPATCAVAGCDRPVDSAGLCHGHDQRRRRTGDVQAHVPLGRRRQPETCTVDGCDRPTKALGLCPRHWWRAWQHGSVDPPGAAAVITESDTRGGGGGRCVEDGCADPAVARDRCRRCYKRALRAGVVAPDPAVRVWTGEGWLSHGYWCVMVPLDERHLSGGAAAIAEHRLVVARSLGRPLAPDEQVHHRNGDRLDNRLENLELWSTSQPSGQRVEDKVRWAVDMIRRYRPDLLADADDRPPES
jgi:hypothetical protein